MAPTDLAEVLQPCSPREFIEATWRKTYRYLPGQPGKFADLLPWSRLNLLLGEHRFEPYRLRVVRETQVIPPSTYQRPLESHSTEQVPRPDPVKLTHLLREGATLIINAIDQMVEPIGQLAENLEKRLQATVQASAFATWGLTPGFSTEPHQDEFDVLVMQVDGRKRWTIYQDALETPSCTGNGAGSARAGEPVWEQVVQPGDLIYLPRGCWHKAAPLAEPTLHLTFACRTMTGIDFLRWLLDEGTGHPILSRDLPLPGAPPAEYLEALRGGLAGLLNVAALERYWRMNDGLAAPRPRFSLPWSAMPEALPSDDRARLQWTVPRPVALRPGAEAETLELWANGEKWQFARAAEAVLRPLMERETPSIDEICSGARESLDRERVRAFLGELVATGLVVVMDPAG